MKRALALTLSAVLMFTLIGNSIVSFAEDNNRVYLGTTTCYNTEEQLRVYDETDQEYSEPETITRYKTVTYSFTSEEEGLYSIKGVSYSDDGYRGGVKIGSAKSMYTTEGTSYCYMEKGNTILFSSNYFDEEDYKYGYNLDSNGYGRRKSYRVTIARVTEKTEIFNEYGGDHVYLVDPEKKIATLTKIRSLSKGIPETILTYPVVGIDEYAYYNLYNLEEVTIPSNIRYINNYAFTNCYKLKKVVIENPDCVYGKDAFFACRNDLQIIGGKMGDVSGGETESVSITSADILGVKNKTYTGKEITQKIAVAIDDDSLTNGEDYTVSYSNNKKVGTATITVTGIGNYYGSIKKTFKINPKGTSIKSVSARSKGFYLKWNKQTVQTSGYQIKYSTDKNFSKNNKTVDISSNKTTSKTIKKLSKNKKYYVKVRAYRIVNGKAYFSSWSSAKSVKTKR